MIKPEPTNVRLDRWLWACRFFKTRKYACDAIRSGHVSINGNKAKPARMVRIEDEISFKKNQLDYTVIVYGLSEKRLGAEPAQQLYSETEASLKAREQIIAERKMNLIGVTYQRRKPSNRDRRRLKAIKRNSVEE